MTVWNIPIEPYEERYTEQWSRWIPNAMKALDIPSETVYGIQETKSIEHGEVLDAYGTSIYKATQLTILLKAIQDGKVKDGDILFFNDLWWPGLESIEYVRRITDKKFKIYGILHAGTWDIHDFLNRYNLRESMYHAEISWMKSADKIFVGSEFHKNLICKESICYKNKIYITGLPFDAAEVRRKKIEKENIIVFPHRLDPEKRPELFDSFKRILSPEFPDWQFVKSKEICKNKKEFYELLAKSKIAVSFALQETFGFAMLEAIANDCVTLVPFSLSYATMPIYGHGLYNTFEEAVEKAREMMRSGWQKPHEYESLAFYSPIHVIKRMFYEDFFGST